MVHWLVCTVICKFMWRNRVVEARKCRASIQEESKSLALDYRSVNWTSEVEISLEATIANAVQSHLDKHKPIKYSQHGFTSERLFLTSLF